MRDDVEMPALQVIVLGSGGGPVESNTTAFLVRSTATKWQKGSLLAVDAGVHLAAIVKLLESHKSTTSETDSKTPPVTTLIDGPFEGLELPFTSAKANAGHITRNLVDTYLITHPHLDHISGFVVNTASLGGTRPKRLAALPSTIDAFRNHIFNNIIWPNLSDENNGAGLVTYMRLVEGGSLAIGEGEGKGYVEVCEGLTVKTWSVSHGHCIESHSHRGGISPAPSSYQHIESTPRRLTAMGTTMQRSNSATSQGGGDYPRPDYFSHQTYQKECVYDSSAYFIRDTATSSEVLMFGDLEPDSVSLSPRNRKVWSDAAPKIVAGLLRGIFIECSYDNSITEDVLFGHLAPRYLINELKTLAEEIHLAKRRESDEKDKENRKRKRFSNGSAKSLSESARRRSHRVSFGTASPISPLSHPQRSTTPNIDVPQLDGNELDEEPENNDSHDYGLANRSVSSKPLAGVKIVIIHVKEKLVDGPDVSGTILKELLEHEEEAGLGCEFIISQAGQSIYL